MEEIELLNGGLFKRESEKMEDFLEDELFVFEKMVKVDAAQRWNDTGIDLFPDSFVAIIYKGGFCQINDSERLLDAAGYRYKKSEPGYMMADFPPGCLIGRVGDNIFHVGQGKVVHHQKGRLYLAVNRIIASQGLVQSKSDTGYFNVMITVTPFTVI